MKGEQVTQRYLERHGFNYPLAITEMEGLGLKLPPPTFSVRDVEQYVGKDTLSRTGFILQRRNGCRQLYQIYNNTLVFILREGSGLCDWTMLQLQSA